MTNPPQRISVSTEYLDAQLTLMELRLVREIQKVKEEVPSDDHVRQIAREEMGLLSRSAWGARSVVATILMLCVAVSTFLLTALRGSGHH